MVSVMQTRALRIRDIATDLHAHYLYKWIVEPIDDLTLTRIADLLNESGIAKLRGTEPWTADDVSDLRKRAARTQKGKFDMKWTTPSRRLDRITDI